MDREQRRARILEVAASAFAEKGYHDARIDDIVVRAGIARGTFYLYFEDKRAIFEHLVDAFVARLGAEIRPIELGHPGVEPMEELRDNLRRVVALFVAERDMARILLSAAVGLDADFDAKLLAFYDEITAILERALSQGEAAGLVRPGNGRIRSFCVMGIIKELLYHQLVLRESEFPSDALVDVMLDLVAGGLFTERSVRELGLREP